MHRPILGHTNSCSYAQWGLKHFHTKRGFASEIFTQKCMKTDFMGSRQCMLTAAKHSWEERNIHKDRDVMDFHLLPKQVLCFSWCQMSHDMTTSRRRTFPWGANLAKTLADTEFKFNISGSLVTQCFTKSVTTCVCWPTGAEQLAKLSRAF